MNENKTISFILPVYNEQEVVEYFFKELLKSLTSLEQKSYLFEFIFIDDGSNDRSLEIIRKIIDHDNRVSVIEFSRNFGHQIAISAGLDYSTGDAVIVMDTDLQDPPRICLDLIHAWENGGEVVYARRRTRKDTIFKKVTAKLFYRFLNILSDIQIPQDTGDFRLFDRKAVEALKKYKEKNRFMRGISTHIGFKQKEVLFDRDQRFVGSTHYSIRKMLNFSMDAIMSFSSAPLRFISKIGFIVSLFSLAGIFYAFFVRFFLSDKIVPGWTFVIIAIFLIGGIQLTVLGVIGSYIARIYTESQGRPLYIVSAVHRSRKH